MGTKASDGRAQRGLAAVENLLAGRVGRARFDEGIGQDEKDLTMDNAVPPREGPLVSVIIPTHNRAHTLARAVRSVLAQTHGNLELIVADDASTDATSGLLSEVGDPRLKYVRHETNRGAGGARNLGLAHVRGDYIAFQDSDDEWLLDKLRMQLEALTSHSGDYGATFGGKLIYGRDPFGRFRDGLSDYRPHRAHLVKSGWMTNQLIVQNLISPQTLMVKASVVRETGPFDERLQSNEDWEFMLRLSTKTKILFTNHPVAVTYISNDSISRNLSSNARSFMLITKKHEALLSRNPKVFGGKLYATARYLHRLERYRSARKYLCRAISVYPWSYRTWLRLALTWLNDAKPSHPAKTIPLRQRDPDAPRPQRSRPSRMRLTARLKVPER